MWDIQNFKCKEVVSDYCQDPYKFTLAFKNLSLDRIDAIVELDQIALLDTLGITHTPATQHNLQHNLQHNTTRHNTTQHNTNAIF